MAAYNDDSIIYHLINKVRTYTDEPESDGKFTNAWLVKDTIPAAAADVISRINNTNNGKIIQKYNVTLSDGLSRYRMPPHVGEILRFVKVDSNGNAFADAKPRDIMHWREEGWRVEGSPGMLDLIVPDPGSVTQTLQMWYVPNGQQRLLFGTTELTSDPETTLTVTTASLGNVDRRNNAYAGAFLRLIPDRSTASTERVAESLISASAYSDSGVTTITPYTTLDHSSSTSTRDFEVVPIITIAFEEAIAIRAASKLGLTMGWSQAKRRSYDLEYLSALKTASDNMTFIQTRNPDSWEKSTLDNIGTGSLWGHIGFDNSLKVSF